MTSFAALVIGLASVGQLDPATPSGSLDETLRNPASITVMADGTVLVTDLSRNHIARFDDSGSFIGTWAVPEGPIDVAAHSNGKYYIALRDERTVGIYTHDTLTDTLVRAGSLGEGNPIVTFVGPVDVDVATDTGQIFVADAAGDTIYRFEGDETTAVRFGIHGERMGQFQYPSALSVDEVHDRVIVADQDNFRIQVFTIDGVYLFRFGYRNKYLPGGGEEGWMPRSQGLAVDAAGRIYLADAFMNTVRIFDESGAELGKVLEYGAPPAGLRVPYGIALSPDEASLYVACVGTGDVQIYDLPVFASRLSGPAASLNSDGALPARAGTNWSAYDAAYRLGATFFDLGPGGGLVFKRPNPVERDPDPPVDDSDSPGLGRTVYNGPHMIEASIICGRCHGIDGQPGGHERTIEGQMVLCASCHGGDGQALDMTVMAAEDAAPFGTNPSPMTGLGRSHPWGVSAVNEAVGSAGPPPGGLLDQYLRDGNIKCATCHDQHSTDAGTPYLRVNNDDGAMCRQCHVDHIGHTPVGPWQPTCGECHDMHDMTSENLSLVAASVFNQTLGLNLPVVFTARTGQNSFSDGGSPSTNDGICQVCHTATAYHRYDSAGGHHAGQDCTTCHPHEAGFMPTGGSCTGCHAAALDDGDGVPVGGRRAVVGEFPNGDAHAHYGAELNDAACIVCHDQATHMDGNVDLLDPDGGALFTFTLAADLASGGRDLSVFCANCHDADGAAALAVPLDPFGNGHAPPDVASKFLGTLQWAEWYGDSCFGQEGTSRQVNSHHDISDTDQAWSGARIECLNCHAAHASGASQPVSDPFNATAAYTGTGNEFCLECHWGGFGPSDPGLPPGVDGPTIPLRGIDSCDYQEQWWYVDYAWTHTMHGPSSKRRWDGYSGAPEYDMECTACHDPHGSYTATNTVGNPYLIKDNVDGSIYVDDGVRPGAQWTGPPWDTFGDSREVVISVNGIVVDWGGATGLCNVCHADWLAAYNWHLPGMCDGCQTCHNHGMAWGNHDWGTTAADENTPCPFNNGCSGSSRVAVDAVVTGDTSSADSDDLPTCGSVTVDNGIWYSVVGTGHTLTATTCLPGTTVNFDTAVQVFCDCETLGCVGGNDDDATCGTSMHHSTFSWCSDPDQVYEIYVGGNAGASGDLVFELVVTDDGIPCGTPPTCRPDPGACCSSVVCAENDTHAECTALGGTDWYLEGDCGTFSCFGACCVGVSCDATNSESECAALGGTWYQGQDCPTYTCPARSGLPVQGDPHGVSGPISPIDDGGRTAPVHEGGPTMPLHRIGD